MTPSTPSRGPHVKARAATRTEPRGGRAAGEHGEYGPGLDVREHEGKLHHGEREGLPRQRTADCGLRTADSGQRSAVGGHSFDFNRDEWMF